MAAYASYQGYTVTPGGVVVPNAEVSVYSELTGLLVSLFSTYTGTGKTNPFNSDMSTGYFRFYAAAGRYRITARVGSTVIADHRDVLLGTMQEHDWSGPSRIALETALSLNCSPSGNDSTGDGSVGAPFRQIQKAIDVASSYDQGLFSTQINVADGAYDPILLKGYVGVGPIAIIGNAANPGNVTITATSNFAIRGADHRAYNIQGMKLVTNTPGYHCILASQYAQMNLGDIEFGNCGFAHIAATLFSTVTTFGNTTISGDALMHWYFWQHALIQDAGKIKTLTGTPLISIAFAYGREAAGLIANANTFSGAADTGTKRFDIEQNAYANTNGQPLDYFPGDVAGTATSGYYY